MRLHLHEWGAAGAPPIVCLHGVTAHGGRFRRPAERLRGFRVLAETAEGCGRRPGDVDRHSFGARLIVELAAREPDRVAQAVLLDPAVALLPERRRALGDRLEVVTVPGGHVVLWDALAKTADAVAKFVGTA